MIVDRRALRRQLFELAAGQGGYFTAAQARGIGYSYQAQAHHVGAGNWLRSSRGLYRLAEWVPEPLDDLARWSLWSDGRAVVSHETALAVHGIGELESGKVHLTVPERFARNDPAVVLHRGDLPPADVVDRSAFQVTTIVRTIVDVAVASADDDQLARLIEEARDLGLVTVRQLRRAAEGTDLRAALHIERALHLIDTP